MFAAPGGSTSAGHPGARPSTVWLTPGSAALIGAGAQRQGRPALVVAEG
jgi:hypothetical protein